MFGKKKAYYSVQFSEHVFEDIISKFESITATPSSKPSKYYLSYENGDEETLVQDPDINHRKNGFRSEYFKFSGYSGDRVGNMSVIRHKYRLHASFDEYDDLSKPESLQAIFDRNYSASRVSTKEAFKDIKVFIGHGRSRAWRDLKDHLQDHHGIDVVAYESGQRAGYTIQEVLSDLSSKATLALLVHTGEDIDANGLAHARENVIHETGLLQGKIGFKRAIVLLEEGTNEFSNIAGLQQIRFAKGNIREAFGDVLAVLRREFAD